MKYVIDASFVASLFLPDEASDKNAALVRGFGPDDAAAPGLLQFEVTNILLMAFRRKRISSAQLHQLSQAFDHLPIVLQPLLTTAQRADVVRLAEKHSLTARDAAYLELASRLSRTLATLDSALLRAAKSEGVKSTS